LPRLADGDMVILKFVMAGKRHHILPRFLLRGFASRVIGDRVFAHVYRKTGNPFETTVENIGLEKHFYGRNGGLSADNVITEIEGDYAGLVTELRAQSDGVEVKDESVSGFVTHMTIRTKQTREFFRTSSEYLFGELTAYFSVPANLKKLLVSKPELVAEELEKLLEKYQLPKEQKRLLIELVTANAYDLVEELLPDLLAGFRVLISNVKTILPTAIKDGHIKALLKDPAAESRSLDYEKLNWFIRESPTPLILGDISCFFETEEQRRFKPLNDKGDRILNVFFPVSTNKLLVGTKHSHASAVDFGKVNEAMAKCSYEYFVASTTNPETARLASCIGEWSGVLTQQEMETILMDIIADLEN
jgi:hypothetical protein